MVKRQLWNGRQFGKKFIFIIFFQLDSFKCELSMPSYMLLQAFFLLSIYQLSIIFYLTFFQLSVGYTFISYELSMLPVIHSSSSYQLFFIFVFYNCLFQILNHSTFNQKNIYKTRAKEVAMSPTLHALVIVSGLQLPMQKIKTQ